jgi:hypothetical protein
VNEFLACITPVNAALLTANQTIGRLGPLVAVSQCTVGTRNPLLASYFNALQAYAATVIGVSEIASTLKDLKGFTTLVRDITQIGPRGVVELDLRAGILYSTSDRTRVIEVTGSPDIGWISMIGDIKSLANDIQAAIAKPQPALLGSPGERWRGGALIPQFPLLGGTVGASPRLPSATATSQSGTPALLAVADPEALIIGAFIPRWTMRFLAAYQRARLAQSQALRTLLGLPARPQDVPSAGVPAGLRLSPEPDVLEVKLAVALNDLLALHDTLADRMESLSEFISLGAPLGLPAQTAARVARDVAELIDLEQVLRARAGELLTPRAGDFVQAVIVARRLLTVDVARILFSPATDAASQAASSAFTGLARQLDQNTPSLRLRLNQRTFHPGQSMILRAILEPGTDPSPVDAYVVAHLPDGSFVSLLLGGRLASGVVPIVAGVSPLAFDGELLRFVLSGTEPLGTYTWMTLLTQAGTGNVIGGIDEDPFTLLK